jgi:hypothetical protein
MTGQHRAPDAPRDLDAGGAFFLAALLFLVAGILLCMGFHLL